MILLEGLGTMHENVEQIKDVHADQSKDVSELLPMSLQSNLLLLRSNNLRNYILHL